MTLCEDEFKEVDKNVKKTVNEASEFSQKSPEPDASELYTDVYL